MANPVNRQTTLSWLDPVAEDAEIFALLEKTQAAADLSFADLSVRLESLDATQLKKRVADLVRENRMVTYEKDIWKKRALETTDPGYVAQMEITVATLVAVNEMKFQFGGLINRRGEK